MKKLIYSILFISTVLCQKELWAQQDNDLSKSFTAVTKFLPVVVNTDKNAEKLVFYRFGWNSKAPATIGVQFSNLGYSDWKIKFAIKDMTTKKMIILDSVHKSFFGTELLKGNSKSAIWSGPVDNVSDNFSLRVWVGDGDEIDKDAVSIKDKEKEKK